MSTCLNQMYINVLRTSLLKGSHKFFILLIISSVPHFEPSWPLPRSVFYSWCPVDQHKLSATFYADYGWSRMGDWSKHTNGASGQGRGKSLIIVLWIFKWGLCTVIFLAPINSRSTSSEYIYVGGVANTIEKAIS